MDHNVKDFRGERWVVRPPRIGIRGRGHIIFLASHTKSQTRYILKSNVFIQMSINLLRKYVLQYSIVVVVVAAIHAFFGNRALNQFGNQIINLIN